jgi:hypothetical protein
LPSLKALAERKGTNVKLALIGFLLMGFASCFWGSSQMTRNYSKALEHGLATIPAARQFQELFPGSHNGYAHYAGVKNTPELQCQTLLYVRYELTFQIEVKFDDQRTKIISYGEPKFSLTEIEKVTPSADGTTDMRSGDLQLRFGAQEWQKVYDARGDFSALGVKLVKDKPVPNLEAWWKKEGEKF